jgi:hypothetical protein
LRKSLEMGAKTENRKKNICFDCRYLKSSHEAKLPWICERFGFKGPFMPSLIVKKESQRDCRFFEAKV